MATGDLLVVFRHAETSRLDKFCLNYCCFSRSIFLILAFHDNLLFKFLYCGVVLF